MPTYVRGQLKNAGKTKQVFETDPPSPSVIMHSTDDITAGDGKRHDVLPGKGAVSNTTACNVFRMLGAAGIPTAFIDQLSPTEMLAEDCDMLPLEVVARRRAQGSILKRQPALEELEIFDELVRELFLKTSGRKWKGKDIPVDDPYISIVGDALHLYLPDRPIEGQEPFLAIPWDDVLGQWNLNFLDQIMDLLERVFAALEKAYLAAGNFELVDMKIEFGITKDGRLVVADVIDAESIRLRRDGKNYDKQPYRDSGLNPEVMERFAEVLSATGKFPH